MDSRATQQCNTAHYHYAVYWLSPANSAFLSAGNNGNEMRDIRGHKLQLSGSTVYSLYCGQIVDK